MTSDEVLMDAAARLEKAFLDIVMDLMNRQGFKLTTFAKQAFPEKYRADPVRRLRAMVHSGKLGKPQRVNLMDAYLMSQALGVELPYLILMACQRVKVEEEGEGVLAFDRKTH